MSVKHPFCEHRAVMIATRRPLYAILGTEAARTRGMSPVALKGHATRKAKRMSVVATLNDEMGRGK